MRNKLKNIFLRYLIDKLYIHFDVYTWNRYRLIRPFLIKGPIKVLNIGTGGGIETLKLLSHGNYVTAIEIDENTVMRTQQRIDRNEFSDRFKIAVGHILSVMIQEQFDEIYMCEVLEHIKDDLSALRRISDWLLPGGRLIISTPTASYGQLFDRQISLDEDGGHVRVGYDGPELDQMLEKVGLLTLRRINNGNYFIQQIHGLEIWLRGSNILIARSLRYVISLMARVFVPILDIINYKPSNQITIAIKRYW
jgi:SAM-dependent methyltransferase